MQTADILRDNLAGLGWYIRRTPDSAALAEWYGGALGLPLIRGRVPVWFFWAAGSLCFELKSDVPPGDERYEDPDSAPMVPVFASRQPEVTLARLERNGGIVAGRIDEDVYVRDTDRQLIAIRPSNGSNSLADPDVNVGASPVPNDLEGWLSTVCRVPDLESELRFYRDVVGLPLIGADATQATFSIGGDVAAGARLELRPGGEVLPPPATREERTDALIFRVDDHDAVNAAFKAAGVPIVNDGIRFNSASLTYVLSPSGRLVGFEERFEPADYKAPRREFLEDREAIQRRKRAKGALSA